VDDDTVTSYSPTTTNVQNVTYDLLVTSSDVWIASWGGGLRKHSLTDTSLADSSWHVVPPDTNAFSSYDYYNHRAFSLAGDDTILWVGTAQGLNKSLDNGQTWTNYNFISTSGGISGNFVTAAGLQKWDNHRVIWAATWPAEGSNEHYGVSKSDNDGTTWQVALTDSVQTLKAHNFAFDGSKVYVATNLGLYKSDDNGQTWEVFPQIVDTSGSIIFDPEVYSALIYKTPLDTTLLVGTGDGVAASSDYGNSWTIFRAFSPTGQNGEKDTYAYPNPFSPRLSPYVVRFQYNMPAAGKVSIRVYDFAMDEVASVLDDQYRAAGNQTAEWFGKRDDGRVVATGVYFYKVERAGASTVWGKVAVIY
jgi:hypothetical protein